MLWAAVQQLPLGLSRRHGVNRSSAGGHVAGGHVAGGHAAGGHVAGERSELASAITVTTPADTNAEASAEAGADAAVEATADANGACGVRLLGRARRASQCRFNGSYGCDGTHRVWVAHGCKGTFMCGGAQTQPFTCGLRTGQTRCECPKGDYCPTASPSLTLDQRAWASAISSAPVPSWYLAAVYGEVPALPHEVRIGSLELLYSASSVQPPHALGALGIAFDEPEAKSSAPPHAFATTDFVTALVRGECFGYTGQGDVSCCSAASRNISGASPLLLHSGSFATTQGQLLYNPFYRESDRRPTQRAPAASGSWVEVTRWPSKCIHALSTSGNGRGLPTPCGELRPNTYLAQTFCLNCGHRSS